jgi:hypothetical protein
MPKKRKAYILEVNLCFYVLINTGFYSAYDISFKENGQREGYNKQGKQDDACIFQEFFHRYWWCFTSGKILPIYLESNICLVPVFFRYKDAG